MPNPWSMTIRLAPLVWLGCVGSEPAPSTPGSAPATVSEPAEPGDITIVHTARFEGEIEPCG